MSNYTAAIGVVGMTKSYVDPAVPRAIDLTVPAGTVYQDSATVERPVR